MSKRPRAPLAPQGGYKQRLRWAEAEAQGSAAASSGPSNSLATLLVHKWAWGEMSTPLVQQIAAAAVEDGAAGHDIKVLAGLGSKGRYPGNMHRELVNHMHPTFVEDAMAQTQAHYRLDHFRGITTLTHQVLLPHTLFHCLFTHHPEAFRDRILGCSEDNVGKFWDSMSLHPAYNGHPITARDNHKSKCVPLAVHGDGVAVSGCGKSWSKTIDVYSWTSMIGRGSTLQSNFLIYTIWWKLVATTNASKNVWLNFSRTLKWSLYWMFIGVWPMRDEEGNAYADGTLEAEKAGTPLAGGYYATLWCIRGDLEHMHKVFGFPGPTSKKPCGLCKCNDSDVPWTDARPDHAAWRDTVWGGRAWLDANPGRADLFKLPGVTISNFVPDLMHTAHLGTYAYFFGGVLQLLTHHTMGGPPAENIQHIWNQVKDFYQARGT